MFKKTFSYFLLVLSICFSMNVLGQSYTGKQLQTYENFVKAGTGEYLHFTRREKQDILRSIEQYRASTKEPGLFRELEDYLQPNNQEEFSAFFEGDASRFADMQQENPVGEEKKKEAGILSIADLVMDGNYDLMKLGREELLEKLQIIYGIKQQIKGNVDKQKLEFLESSIQTTLRYKVDWAYSKKKREEEENKKEIEPDYEDSEEEVECEDEGEEQEFAGCEHIDKALQELMEARKDVLLRTNKHSRCVVTKTEDGTFVHTIVQLKAVNQGTKSLVDTLKGSICPLMATRHTQLVGEYLVGFSDDIDNLTKVEHAKKYGMYVKIEKKVPINCVDKEGVDKIIQVVEPKIPVMAISSAFDVELHPSLVSDWGRVIGFDDILELKDRLIEKDNFVYGFVMGTGEKGSVIGDSNLSVANRSKIGGMHWISVVLAKINGQFYWFVINSGSGCGELVTTSIYIRRISFLIKSLMNADLPFRAKFFADTKKQQANLLKKKPQPKRQPRRRRQPRRGRPPCKRQPTKKVKPVIIEEEEEEIVPQKVEPVIEEKEEETVSQKIAEQPVVEEEEEQPVGNKIMRERIQVLLQSNKQLKLKSETNSSISHTIVQLNSVQQHSDKVFNALKGNTCPFFASYNTNFVGGYLLNIRDDIHNLTNEDVAIAEGERVKNITDINLVAKEDIIKIIKALGNNDEILPITVIDSALKVETLEVVAGQDEIALVDTEVMFALKCKLQDKDNFVHGFVMGTGDENAVRPTIDMGELTSNDVNISEMHWISIVLAKVNGEFYWFGLNSTEGNLLAGYYLDCISYLIKSLMDDDIKFKREFREKIRESLNNRILQGIIARTEKKKKEEEKKKVAQLKMQDKNEPETPKKTQEKKENTDVTQKKLVSAPEKKKQLSAAQQRKHEILRRARARGNKARRKKAISRINRARVRKNRAINRTKNISYISSPTRKAWTN